MQDEVFARVLEKIRPGMTDNEVTALAQYEGRLLGSVQGLFLGSSAPLGQARTSSIDACRRAPSGPASTSRC